MTDEAYKEFLEWREIGTPCNKCLGSGVVTYGSTSVFMGGAGGQMTTSGTCDLCWGTGDADRKGVNKKEFLRMRKQLKQK